MKHSLVGRAVGYADLARHARKLRSTDEIVRRNAEVHLTARMGRLRGLPQKIGQILSMGREDDLAQAASNMTDSAEPLPFEDIESELEEAWGLPIDDVVGSMDRRGLAASLGQVHRAELLDGREVAVKVQYPNIRQATRNDLKMLGWLSAPVGDLRRGFDINAYRAEILRDLEEELDYRVEAEHQRRYRDACTKLPGWIVPEVVDSLSSDKVLVTRWVDGQRIEEAMNWPAEERFRLADTLIKGFLSMLFGAGRLHADPHPGNYRFLRSSDGPRVVLYDFGSVANISLEHRLAILKLIQITAQCQGDPFKLLVALGFDEQLLSPIRSKLAAVCRTLFEPFCVPGKFDVSNWNRAERMEHILGDDRWNFRMSAPAHLILVMRAFSGLCFYLERLGEPVSWSLAVRPHLEEFQAALAGVDVSAPAQQEGVFESIAKHLKIRVTQDNVQKVALTFPSSAVDGLGDLMGEELVQRIESQNLDLNAIVRRARETAYRAQELFVIEESAGKRGVRVWLE